MAEGEYESANLGFKELLQKDGNNLDVLKDWAYFNLLTKNYTKAIETGKAIIERPDVDEQCYQLLGMGFKATAAYADCDKLYQRAFKKFPKSGVLFNEAGELAAMQKNLPAAIIQWEKGINADPNYSSNYYNATMYYNRAGGNTFKVLIYGELFANVESYTIRTADVKEILLEKYKTLFTTSSNQWASATASSFEKAFFETLSKSAIATNTITPETLTAIRTRFLLNWFAKKQNAAFPFYLFNHQQYLLQEGLYDAYNQWLFGPVAGVASYQIWLDTHEAAAKTFRSFQQGRVFKMPTGQYYK